MPQDYVHMHNNEVIVSCLCTRVFASGQFARLGSDTLDSSDVLEPFVFSQVTTANISIISMMLVE